jgi:uncharacterized protein
MPIPPPDPGSIALVTGASSGIGTEIARRLAERGHGVGLIARRRERLESLARELADAHGVRAEPLPADLSDADARDRLARDVEGLGLAVEVLVNNAGFGVCEPFGTSRRERELEQVRVLVEAVVDLSARYLPGMLERRHGAILNVASTSGFQPLPGNADYAASKAFVIFHSEAVHEEVRDRGVTVTAVCPGPVDTEFLETSQPLFARRLPKSLWVSPETVAEEGLRALEQGKRTIVPGGLAVRAAFAPNRMAPAAIALPGARVFMSRELARGRGSSGTHRG